MKSIMHQKDGTCYLCMNLNCDYSVKATEEHHVVFGTAGRELSERYGLKVYLCPEHHRTGKDSAHLNHDIARMLQKDSQRGFIRNFHDLDFCEIFGMNYLDSDEAVAAEHDEKFSIENGFHFI